MINRTRLTILITALIMIAPPAAEAHARKHPARAALEWPTVPNPPKFWIHRGDCPDQDPELGPVGGCAYNDPNSPMFGNIYTVDGDRFAVYHELGHLYDAELLDDADRSELETIFGLTGPWNQGTGAEGGDHSPDEWEADMYARCRLHITSRSHFQVSSYTESMSPKRTLAICNVFHAAAHRAGMV